MHNAGWQSVRVYAVRAGSPMRLGSVDPLKTVRFRLRPGMLGAAGSLQLMLRPLASNAAYMIDPVLVGDSQFVQLDVQRQLSLSSVAVFAHEIR